MATEPLTMDIIFQLMVIAILMVILGLILNKILGIKPSKMKELRYKARNLRERVSQAEILEDTQLMQELQSETMQLMKQMLKKQLIPMCIRCIIFLGIFIVIGMFYNQYESWFWVYFLFSFSFSLLVFGLTKLYRKVSGKEDKKKFFAKEIMGTIYPTKQGQGLLHLPGHPATESLISTPSHEESNNNEENQESKKSDAWKDRIQS